MKSQIKYEAKGTGFAINSVGRMSLKEMTSRWIRSRTVLLEKIYRRKSVKGDVPREEERLSENERLINANAHRGRRRGQWIVGQSKIHQALHLPHFVWKHRYSIAANIQLHEPQVRQFYVKM